MQSNEEHKGYFSHRRSAYVSTTARSLWAWGADAARGSLLTICRQVIFPIPLKWFQQSETFPSTSILLKHNFSVLEVLLPGAPEVPPAWPEDLGCSSQKSSNLSLKAALVWPWPMELRGCAQNATHLVSLSSLRVFTLTRHFA